MARFWTKGYDVYSPSRVIVAHDYDDKNLGEDDKNNIIASSSWSKNGQTPEYRWMMYQHAVKRLKTLMGQDLGTNSHAGLSWMRSSQDLSLLTKYGLGTRRTLDQFIEFTGLDPKSGSVIGDRCKGLEWVPHQTLVNRASLIDPTLDEGDPWGMAGEPAHAGGRNIPLLSSSFDVNIYHARKRELPRGASVTMSDTSNGDGEEAKFVSSGETRWFLSAQIDWALEKVIRRIESTRPGSGVRLTKILLLGVPLILTVFILGIWALMGESESDSWRDGSLTPRVRSPEKMV